MKRIWLILLAAGVFTWSFASFDGVSANTSSYEGYNLFAPIQSTDTYLMDNDGNVVHTWASAYRPGQSVYLLEDGTLLRTANTQDKSFNVGGAGGRVERLDWNGTLLWKFEHHSELYRLHHDVEMLPNGNVLMISWERKTEAEAVTAGRDPSLLSEGELWPDYIIEVQPTGSSGGNIVWEWHVWDHLLQDHDPDKANYGVVADHPELIDLNYTLNSLADWTHINSIDYNAELDQIVLSAHNFSEIWIIDHSTTSAEAAGHTGGTSGHGGDLLYRWGNPRAYATGSRADQQLFGQHDAEWIEDGLPGAGDILIFNNGQGRPGSSYSSVDEIVLPLQPDGIYEHGLTFGPTTPIWTYQASPSTDFYAENISGSQRLPNGNTLICDGPAGEFFEVAADGTTVWSYPYGSAVFRVERYDPTYPGLNPGDDSDLPYKIVDTSQTSCYDNSGEMACPQSGQAFYGQDAQFTGNQPSYTLGQDGLTVHDNVTGLIWTRSPDLNADGEINVDDKLSFDEANAYPQVLNAESYGGYSDWRLPSIKELYSLMDFRGTDPAPTSTDPTDLTPFIDTTYFAFAYGDLEAGERIIDAQFWSRNVYVGTVFDGRPAAFGLNLADGRIKGYPSDSNGSFTKLNYVYFVRGNTDYGVNSFSNNGDGTLTDKATGLMWSQDDSGAAMNWQEALAWVQTKNDENYLGYSDWRFPNAKEMQSIVDYSRAPDATDSAAIDPVFNSSRIINEAGELDYPWFWTGTTHVKSNGGGYAGVYICFGRAMGYMNGSWMDVHGAGAQRSDPKEGDPADYPYGQGPQGDAIRIYNYVRLVRDTSKVSVTTGALTVQILPQAACEAGAQWKLDGGEWHDCGETVSELSVGQRVLRFKRIPRWRKPKPQTVEIQAAATTAASGTYVSLRPLPWLGLLPDD